MAYRLLSLRVIQFAAVVLLLFVAATPLPLAFGGSAEASNQLHMIKTAGTGGAVVLLLDALRQRTAEIALRQKDRDQAHSERGELDSAAERRISEQYIKAADQPGSDKAAVRLAGLYARCGG
ncbi:hypothetical protein [Amycolatopsis sp. CA-230715]|uniref:hypothetical protein n=1 Tax=Amycolatopsis sp. CA-230715 TaxID=2745196 RepID=UPI001C00E039|nr:hypothetical protein [Amycolatopsis sp. CA-230715]QWF85928.1 hypothetical protein HUW46_09408 [Amycolatopsis sp. CA-230715]